MSFRIRTFFLIGFSLLSAPVLAESDGERFSEIAQKTVELRQEVEMAVADAEAENKRLRSEWDATLARRAETEARLQKERAREVQLREKSAALRARLKTEEKEDPQARKIVQTWLNGLRARVESSLPFRRRERLAEVEGLQARFDAGEPASQVLSALWDLTNRQLRQGRENAFEIVDITLADGEIQKAEVARMGWVQMAFRTPDGRAGFARRTSGQWSLEVGSDSVEREAAERMVAKFREKSTSGYFELPTPTVGGEK